MPVVIGLQCMHITWSSLGCKGWGVLLYTITKVMWGVL